MLEVLAYRYAQSEGQLVIAALLLLVFGAVAASFLFAPRQDTLSRSFYLLRLGLATLLLLVNQFWWFLYVPALKVGASVLLLMTDVTGYLLFGAYVIRIAQARSNDAYGTPSRAFFALVPFANLVLLFRNSQVPDERQGSIAAALLGAGCIVAARIASAGLEVSLTDWTVAGMQDPAAVAAMQRIMIEAEGVEAGLDNLIAAENAPVQAAADLMLTSVSRKDLHVTYEFRLDQTDATSLNDAYRSEITASFCAATRYLMVKGASFTLHYIRPDGATVETLELAEAECSV